MGQPLAQPLVRYTILHIKNTQTQFPHTQAATHGPRATEGFAAVAAACVGGLAGVCGAVELAAGFVEGTAKGLEKALREKDTCVMCWCQTRTCTLCVFICTVYDFMTRL